MFDMWDTFAFGGVRGEASRGCQKKEEAEREGLRRHDPEGGVKRLTFARGQCACSVACKTMVIMSKIGLLLRMSIELRPSNANVAPRSMPP